MFSLPVTGFHGTSTFHIHSIDKGWDCRVYFTTSTTCALREAEFTVSGDIDLIPAAKRKAPVGGDVWCYDVVVDWSQVKLDLDYHGYDFFLSEEQVEGSQPRDEVIAPGPAECERYGWCAFYVEPEGILWTRKWTEEEVRDWKETHVQAGKHT